MIKSFGLLLLLFMSFSGTCQSDQAPNYWIGDQVDGFKKISAKGYFGLMDSLGTVICAPKYDAIGEFQGEVAIVRLNGTARLINRKGEEISAIYTSISDFSEGLAAVNFEDKCGYINATGKEIIPLIYDEQKAFSNGLAAVKRKGRWGYINTKGKVVVPFRYSSARNFDRETAIAERDGSYLIIDKKGQEIKVLPYYDVYGNYLESGFLVRDSSGHFGLIDEVGKELISCEFVHISHISHIKYLYSDLFSVQKDRKWGIVSSNSKTIADVIYDQCHVLNTSEGQNSLIIAATLNGKMGVIDGEGKTLLPFIYERVHLVSNELLIAFTSENSGYNKCEIFTSNGERIGDRKYADAAVLSENYIMLFNQTGTWSEIDLMNRSQAPPEYPTGVWEVLQVPGYKKMFEISGGIEMYDAHTFKVTTRISNNSMLPSPDIFSRSRIQTNSEWFLCDSSGQAISEPQLIVQENDRSEEIYRMETKDGVRLFGMVNKEGVLVTPIIYESMMPLQIPNYFRVTQNKKMGVVNREGEIIIPCSYDEIDCTGNCFQSGLIKVRNERNCGLLDLTGEVVIPLEWYEIYNYIYDDKIEVQKLIAPYTVRFYYINKQNEIVGEKH